MVNNQQQFCTQKSSFKDQNRHQERRSRSISRQEQNQDCQKRQFNRSQSRSSNVSKPFQSRKFNNKCGRCGQISRYKCPATDIIYRKCGKRGHFQVMCRSKKVNHMMEVEDFFIGQLNSKGMSEWTINLFINKCKIECILHTGSDANVISLNV